jgi:heme exporter protein D
MYNPFILVFAVFGAILLTLMFCICIIVLRLKGIICRGRYLRGMQRQNEQRQQQMEQTRAAVLELLDIAVPTKRFGAALNHLGSTSCCICFEEFKDETPVKETACLHIFDAKCL